MTSAVNQSQSTVSPPLGHPLEHNGPRLTEGTGVLQHLETRIAGLQSYAPTIGSPDETRSSLIELITLRGLLRGRVADYDRALAMADGWVDATPTRQGAWLARARVRSALHQFQKALDDLDTAEWLGLDLDTGSRERATILQAIGRYDDARSLREEAVRNLPNFDSVAALAELCAECDAVSEAECLFVESLGYRDTAPFPLAVLEFRLGRMWMRNGRSDQARRAFESAHRRVPAFVPVRGHLAEIEAESGDLDAAILRLRPLAISSDDPGYAAQLARTLSQAGCPESARPWRDLAAARYDELVAAHPAAFADPAAEFWLTVGFDSAKAVELARMNLEVRFTPRARKLLARALTAAA